MQTYKYALPKMRITLISAVIEFIKHSLNLRVKSGVDNHRVQWFQSLSELKK